MGIEELNMSPDVRRLNPSLGGKLPVKKGNKYGVAAKMDRTYKGQVYASKKEMLKAQELDLMMKTGEIDFYLEQVPFKLPGNSKHLIDFVTFKGVLVLPIENWAVHYIEVKGRDLALGRLKRKQTEAIYKIIIEVV